MATRFYLIPGSTPPVSPAFDASWEKTSQAVRRVMTTYREPSPPATGSETIQVSENVATNPYDVLAVQLVSGTLNGAQTVGGGGATLKGRVRVRENNASADFRAQLLGYVVSGDGGTVRGTFLAHDASALTSEFATSLTNRKFPLGSPAALSSVSAQDGDRIVVEIGLRSHNGSTTNFTSDFDVRQDGAADLAEDETDTGLDNPWLEFSETFDLDDVAEFTTLVGEVAAQDATETKSQFTTLVVEVAVANDLGFWDLGMDIDLR